MGNLIKYLMFTSNLVFWAIGGAMLGVGIWMTVDEAAKDMAIVAGSAGMNEDVYWAAVGLMIGIGALVFIVGFFGCFGAMRAPEEKCALKIYFATVKFILLVELVSLILCGVFWDSLNESVQKAMAEDAIKRDPKDNSTLSKAWNNMEKTWECCGGIYYIDYQSNMNTNFTVPESCCKVHDNGHIDLEVCFNEGRSNITTSKTELYEKGCYDGLKDFIDEKSTILITITCIFMGLQVFGSFCACMLLRK